MPARIQVTPVYFQTHAVFAGGEALGQCERGDVIQTAVILLNLSFAVIAEPSVIRAIKRIGDQLAVGRGIVVAPQSIGERVVLVVVDVEVAVHPTSLPIDGRLYLRSGICFEHIVGLVHIDRLMSRRVNRYRNRGNSVSQGNVANIAAISPRCIPFVCAIWQCYRRKFCRYRGLLRQSESVYVGFQSHTVHQDTVQLVSCCRFGNDSQHSVFCDILSVCYFRIAIEHAQRPFFRIRQCDVKGIGNHSGSRCIDYYFFDICCFCGIG